jgi:acyl dehydratase
MSGEERVFEEVEIGMTLPPLTKGPLTVKDLVKFGAATNDYSEIHYDSAAVRARGLPAPVVHGPLKAAFLAQMLTAWAGPAGVLTRLSCQYRRMDAAGETLTCRGKVTGKSSDGTRSLVECEVWTENSQGEITTKGSATVELPRRQAEPRAPAAPAVSHVPLITEEMRRTLKLGEVSGVLTYDVDRRWVQQFAGSFGDPNPLWHDEEYARR